MFLNFQSQNIILFFLELEFPIFKSKNFNNFLFIITTIAQLLYCNSNANQNIQQNVIRIVTILNCLLK